MTPTPTIRRVTPDDFEGLVTLYNEVWPKVSYDKKKKTIIPGWEHLWTC